MRAEASVVDTQKVRDGRSRPSRAAEIRRHRLRALALEGLEERTLLATLPAVSVTGDPLVLAGASAASGVNLSAPMIKIDPIDPMKMVAVWTVLDPSNTVTPESIDAMYSTDGGQTWTDLQNVGSIGNDITDFTSTATPPPPFPDVTDPSVGFDAHDHFYIMSSAHEADESAGQITEERYTFSSDTPVQTITDQPVDLNDVAIGEVGPLQWAGSADGAIYSPNVTVDADQATFTGTDANGTTHAQTDTLAAIPVGGQLYGQVVTTFSTATDLAVLQNSTAFAIISKDGGQTFYALKQVSAGEIANAPQATISQGRAAGVNGAGTAVPAVQGGTVTAVFDDSSSLETASPPLDRIVANRITSNGSYTFTTSPNTKIKVAATAAGQTPVPQTTTIPLNVNVPDFDFFLKDMTASVTLTYGNLSELKIQLVSPSGLSVILLNNHTNANGSTNANVGASGVNLGPTVFNSTAATSLEGTTGGASTVGNFLAEGPGTGTAGVGLDTVYGGQGYGGVTGTWDLVITDFGTTTGSPAGAVSNFSLKFTDDTGLVLSGEEQIGTTAVLGQFNEGVFPNAAAALVAPNTGFGPDPQIVSDNTLGGNDPYSGRIYVAYVTHPVTPAATTYPADDSNITLLYSDDGGATWAGGTQVNDDDKAGTDGFSGGDRPAFQPSLAVDPTTGTLAASWYDARNDAARARVATYVATSIDGGTTFSTNQFVNPSLTATDTITGDTVVLGPVPDNESKGNANADKTFAYGEHQGLAFYGGVLYPIFASNANGGSDGSENLGIVVGQAVTAAGPRVVSSTMGPVGLTGDTLNTSTSPDGGPEATALTVTFDRPIQPSSFTAGDIKIYFQSAYAALPANGLGTLVPGTYAVTPVVTANDPNNDGRFGYTTFKVTFAAQTFTDPSGQPSYVGDYSYVIAPDVTKAAGTDINSGIDTVQSNEAQPPSTPVFSTVVGSFFDQNANGVPLETTDVYQVPNPNDEGDTLPLIVPGPHVVSTSVVGGTGSTNEVLNGTVSGITLVFDRAINPATFTAASVLRMQGPAGLIQTVSNGVVIPGPFTVTEVSATTYTIGFPTQTLSGTYTVSLASSITDTNGDALDTNLNAGVYVVRGSNPYAATTPNLYKTTTPAPITAGSVATPSVSTSSIVVGDSFAIQGVKLGFTLTYPNDPDLTAYLVSPGGTRVLLFSGVGATGGANFTGTTIDETITPAAPISQGGAPFFGTYDPQVSLNNSFVVANGGPNSAGTWTLEVDNAGTSAGSIASWSLTLLSKVGGTGLGEPTADQATASFRIFDDAPSNRLSSDTWTSVGPAPIYNANNNQTMTGTATAITVDPSDPSGNTVFAGGANGGVWKTTNFLTTAAQGPTWIPLTDFGPTTGVNVGSIAVFPRGNDPTKSIVLVGTGDGQNGTKGIGFLRSMDGGATWQWLDGTNNTSYANSDHLFSQNLTYTNKIVADPTLDSTGDVIFYAALGGSASTAGVWRSIDSGTTWQLLLGGKGDATDVTLDPNSGTGVLGGNLQIVYSAFPGSGVFESPNQGQSWFGLLGTTGDPLIQDVNTGAAIPVAPLGPTPVSSTTGGRILLAKPFAISNNPSQPGLEDQLYEGWLYALVVTNNALDGLYLTKDYGQNWTKVHLGTENYTGVPVTGNPTNDTANADYDPFTGFGNSAVSFGIDPTNPNVVYIGGSAGTTNQTGFLRVDTTGLYDPHAFTPFTDNQADGGLLTVNTTGPVSLQDPTMPADLLEPPKPPTAGVPTPSSYLNLIRDPLNAFNVNATLLSQNVAQFNNTGADAKWFPISNDSAFLDHSGGQHDLVTIVDPLTGHARLIVADDHGIFTGVDNAGTFETSVGTAAAPLGSRNGNLALTQFYYGAVQPSAHTATGAVIFYGGAQNVGGPTSASSPNDVLSSGNLTWSGPAGNVYGVATDPTGSGTVYQFVAPSQAGTNFFQVNTNGTGQFVGRTFNLTTGPTDPQWFGVQATFNGGLTRFGNFTVNSVNGNQIIISSANGSVYRTENLGVTWFQIAATGTLDGSYAPALAFGAPDPSAPNGIGNLDNFIYAGTLNGNIYATRIGGGTLGGGNAWTLVGSTANGLDGSTVQQIVTNPTRGSHAAYAVTLKGVYYNPNTLATGSTWTNISGNLFSLTIPAYGNAAEATSQLTGLTSIQVDWRYLVPNSTSGTNPVLYVSGNGGVYRSLNNGATWTDFPTASLELDDTPAFEAQTTGVEGGYLPNTQVNTLSMATGNVNPQTGRATAQTGDPSILVAATYGRGQFAIRLSPLVIPNTPNAPAPNDPHAFLTIDPKSLYGETVDNFQVTTIENPIIDGYSEQSAFGNTITVKIYNLGKSTTLPTNLTVGASNLIGTGTTDANGKFSITTGATSFTVSGYYYVGVQATDQSGGVGNLAILKILVELPAVLPPTKIVLDPGSDSGTFNNDDYTNDNNSSAHPAPVFDVSGILPGASVVLLRNGVVVDTVTNTAGGTVQIADTNGGNGTIPDSPVGTPVDTPPPSGNPYIYTSYQIDANNLQSGPTNPGLQVIIDSTAPLPPSKVVLDPTTDSGTLNGDDYTNANNSSSHPAPLFDVSGIEPNATVVLLRNGVIVNVLTHTAGGTVQIPDVNGAYGGNPGNGPIPDSPVGSPPDTAPPFGNPYSYTAYQIDLAGNQSGSSGSKVFGNLGAVVIDGTDADHHGDSLGGPNGNQNEDGWLYMQIVLNAIQPNITDGQKILVALGSDPSQSFAGQFGAAASIQSAFNQSVLPSLGWSVEYVVGAANMQTYLSGGAAPAELYNGSAVTGGVKTTQTGLLYITTDGHTSGDLTDDELTVINNNGPAIKNYVNTGGGLYSQAESPITAGVTSYGWLSSIFPAITAVDDGTQGPNDIQITPEGMAAFPTLTAADISAGPWHNYFTGTFGALSPAATDVDDGGTLRDLILTSTGVSTIVTVPGLPVIIDSTAPAIEPLTLDAGSDSGTFNNDQVTQDNNNGATYPAPNFDLANAEPNAIVQLYRAKVVNGVAGTPVLVDTQTVPANAALATFVIADTNAGAGKIADGTYQYTAKQTDLAGNVGPLSTPITVIVDATAPVAPSTLSLDPGSDTGTFNNDKVTKDNNSGTYPPPYFDAQNVEAHATLELFRAPITNGIVGAAVKVNVLVNVATGGTVLIPDVNGAFVGGTANGTIPDGTYQYSAKQVDLAGNISPLTNTLNVIISTALPTPQPAPKPVLDPASDSGTFNNDDITQDNNGNPYPAPVFDIGTVAVPVGGTETVQLYRAPVVNGVTGAAVLVDTLTNVAGGKVQIADTNAGNGRIADGTYVYTDLLTTLAGVPGTMSAGLTVIIDATSPVAPAPFRLDAASDTGVSNSDGITQITLVHFPVFDVGGVVVGATVELFRNGVLVNSLTNTAGGTVDIQDNNQISDGTYVYTVKQIDLAGNVSAAGGPITVVYDTVQPGTPPIPVLDPASDTGIKGDDVTSDTSPFFDFTITLTGAEQNSRLSLVRDGTVVATSTYTVGSGAMTIQDPGAVPYGTHSYQAFLTDKAGNVSAYGGVLKVTFSADATGTLVLDPASDSGVKGDDITNVTKPTFDAASLPANETLRLLRGGTVVATAPTGGGGTITITDPGPLTSNTYSYTAVLVSLGGVASPPGPALSITVDTSVPAAPTGLTLDPGSDSGVKGDNITNVTAPTFDASSVLAGATVQLLRNGAVVGSATSVSGGTVMVTDPGPLFRGSYVYTTRQISVAGNTGGLGAPLTITIDTSTPTAPTLALDPGSDSGTKGDNQTDVTTPYFDASGVVAGATVTLYRNGVVVGTATSASGGTVLVQDPGPLSVGQYVYSVTQTSAAGSTSASSTALTITVVTAPATPTTPTLGLSTSSDTGIKGDGITSARNLVFNGVADPGVTVKLFSGAGTLLGSATANGLGAFSIPLASPLVNGTYTFKAQATNGSGATSAMTALVPVKVVTVAGDYTDAGASSDAIVRRVNPNLLSWYVKGAAGLLPFNFGAGSLDVPVAADFNGDGKDDPTIYRPSTGQWYDAPSGGSTYTGQALVTFGGPNDVPVPDDYNGTGTAVEAVFRPSTGQWFIYAGGNGHNITVPGLFPVGSQAAEGDYTGVGKAQPAVYFPANSEWLADVTTNGVTTTQVVATFGGPNDQAVPGQYDNIALTASGKPDVTEAAVWRPSTGQFFVHGVGGNRTYQFAVGDIPAPGDYDGIGETEPAVYRPSAGGGQLLVYGPNDTTSPHVIATFGGPADIPLLSPYPYRAVSGGGTIASQGIGTGGGLVPGLGGGGGGGGGGGATQAISVGGGGTGATSPGTSPLLRVLLPGLPNQSAPAATTLGASGEGLFDDAIAALVGGVAKRKVRQARSSHESLAATKVNLHEHAIAVLVAAKEHREGLRAHKGH